MFERRKYLRADPGGSVKLIMDSNPSKILKGYLIDVSFAGLAVYLKEKPVLGNVQFELVSYLRAPISGRGVIKYIQEVHKYNTPVFRAGIEFIDIDKGDILDLCNKIQAKIREEIRKTEKTGREDIIWPF